MSTDSEDVQAHPDTNSTAFATRAAQHYHVHAGAVWGLAPPVVFSSTYMVADAAQADRLAHKNPSTTTDEDGYFYSRWGNPTNEVAADVVSLLEGATGTRTFASGMNAITTLMMTLLVSGDHVVAPRAIYAGTYEWLAVFGPRMNISVTWVDATDVAAYRAAVQPNTRLLYAESPSNPTMRLTDLEALGALSLSLEGQTACVVDSTFATPYHCNPLSFAGVDAVVHSATKYMGGHSDLTAGTVSANDPQLLQNLGKASRLFGGPLAAMDSFLLQRGLKTLDVRMERHARNALHVATFLESHPAVLACHYPGLQSHPDHALAKCQFRQGSGFGGMLSFDVGSVEAGKKVVEAVQLANLAVSLGAVETLIEHPASMTHACIPREQRLAAGITDGLIRLSVGLEAPVDLLADLDQALELACSDEARVTCQLSRVCVCVPPSLVHVLLAFPLTLTPTPTHTHTHNHNHNHNHTGAREARPLRRGQRGGRRQRQRRGREASDVGRAARGGRRRAARAQRGCGGGRRRGEAAAVGRAARARCARAARAPPPEPRNLAGGDAPRVGEGAAGRGGAAAAAAALGRLSR